MNRVQQHFKGKIKIKYDLITQASYRDCIYRKSCADIVLDECVTPSYHLTSLEGLALGRPTICWTDERVEQMLYKVSGATTNPFLGTYVGWLEDYLVDMIEHGPQYLLQEGKKSKAWFNKYWKPQDVLQEYLDIYDSL